jgi:hypothetical protein
VEGNWGLFLLSALVLSIITFKSWYISIIMTLFYIVVRELKIFAYTFWYITVIIDIVLRCSNSGSN